MDWGLWSQPATPTLGVLLILEKTVQKQPSRRQGRWGLSQPPAPYSPSWAGDSWSQDCKTYFTAHFSGSPLNTIRVQVGRPEISDVKKECVYGSQTQNQRRGRPIGDKTQTATQTKVENVCIFLSTISSNQSKKKKPPKIGGLGRGIIPQVWGDSEQKESCTDMQIPHSNPGFALPATQGN